MMPLNFVAPTSAIIIMVKVTLLGWLASILVITIDGDDTCRRMGIISCPAGKARVFEAHKTPIDCNELVRITARSLLGCTSVALPKGFLITAYFENGVFI